MKPATYAVLNLQALAHNLAKVREYAKGAQVMAVIKANGYGHGLQRVAKALEDADAFAVARVDEAMRLREAGIAKRIVVLEGFTCVEELQQILDDQVDFVIHSFAQLEMLENHTDTQTASVWLKLDTGMNRLGFTVTEFDEVYQRLDKCQCVSGPIQLMTHLANADIRTDQKTVNQLALFDTTVSSYSGERSIANSAGVLAWQQTHADWVRPGIMLYGVSPFTDNDGSVFGLQSVMSLHSSLLAVKPVNTNETIGYGGQWLCKKPTLLGVIAAGYGDGYPRQVAAGTPVLVNNIRVPIIGRVSMDMMTVDLQDCPNAKVGDPVILWGSGLPVEEIAGYADTIPYTLLCGITQRVQIIENVQTDKPTSQSLSTDSSSCV